MDLGDVKYSLNSFYGILTDNKRYITNLLFVEQCFDIHERLHMEEIFTKATSSVTAQASDIVLRETQTIRLVFRPMIIDNPNDRDASIKGSFLYQRKSIKLQWEDFETIPLSKVKVGEGYKLEVKSAELLDLINQLKPLYELHRDGGVPRGERKFVQSTPQLEQLSALTVGDINDFLNANTAVGTSLISKLLNWAVTLDDPTPIIARLVEINPTSLGKLNAAIGLQSLKNALSTDLPDFFGPLSSRVWPVVMPLPATF